MQENKIKNFNLSSMELLTIAWEVFKKNWRIFLSFLFLIAIPFNFFNNLIQSGDISTNSSNILLFIIFLSINIISFLITIIITEKTIFNTPIKIGTAFLKSVKKLFFVFLFNLMAFIPIFIAFASFLIPGIYLIIRLIFINQAIILRNTYDPFNYSSQLVKGKWWKVFGSILYFPMAFLGIAIPVIVLQVIVMNLLLGNDSTLVNYVSSLFTIINNTINLFLSYLFTIYLTTLFINIDYVSNDNKLITRKK